MTHPNDSDALDAWWTLHGNGDRHQPIGGNVIDIALMTFNQFKEMQRQGREPEGYNLDDPALVDAARVAQQAADAKWAKSLMSGEMIEPDPADDDDGN